MNGFLGVGGGDAKFCSLWTFMIHSSNSAAVYTRSIEEYLQYTFLAKTDKPPVPSRSALKTTAPNLDNIGRTA